MATLASEDFKTAQISAMKPGESKTIHCESFRSIQTIRALCAQHIKYNKPDGISRFATSATANEDGSYELTVTAMTC